MSINSIGAAKQLILNYKIEKPDDKSLLKAVNYLISSPDDVQGEVDLALRKIVVAVADPKITNTVAVFFCRRSCESIPQEVKDHPAFHPKAMLWSLTSLDKVLAYGASGNKKSLSSFQRTYCDSNLKYPDTYLIRQSTQLDKRDKGTVIRKFVISQNKKGKVTHILIQRHQDETGQVSWSFGEEIHSTLQSITNKYCRDLTIAPQPH